MKISIITVCFNSEKFISQAIDSVLNQSYEDIEYIVVDGNSNDRTIDIVKSYGNKIAKFISEPDDGIFDAMNKGINLANGDIVGMLNSDDLYADNTILSKVVECFKNLSCEMLYGNLVYVKQENTEKIVRKWIPNKFELNSFKKGWHPPHPSLFVAKKIYEKYENFRLKFNLAADFELMLRLFEKEKVTNHYLPSILVKMRMGGASNKSFFSILKQNYDCYRAFKANDIEVSIFYSFYRVLPKLKDRIKKLF